MVVIGFRKAAKIREKAIRKYVWYNAFKVSPSDGNLKWVVLINRDKQREVTICNYNPYLNVWEVAEGEEVLSWMNFEDFLPETPNYSSFLIKNIDKGVKEVG